MKYPTLGQAILIVVLLMVLLSAVGGMTGADTSTAKKWVWAGVTLWFIAGLAGTGNEGFKTEDVFRPRRLLADLLPSS